VGEVVRSLASRWPAEARAELRAEAFAAAQPHEARTLRLDTSRAQARLGWRPALTLAEALELTARWYADAPAGDAADICRAQIEWYAARACAAPQGVEGRT
jgi:CDP-glucose 4,6-dehydratase